MKLLLTLLSALFLLSGVGMSSLSAPSIDDLLASTGTPGAGRTVNEKWPKSSGGNVRYEGLGEGQTKGTRWIQIGETWQKSGTWKASGEDVKTFADDGTHVWTLKDLNKDGEQHGLIEEHIGSKRTGSWGPAS